jgi:NAD-dependent SIR2 family protein deacetylase
MIQWSLHQLKHSEMIQVWSWYNDRRKKILAAKPNAGHIARRHPNIELQSFWDDYKTELVLVIMRR